MTLLLSFASLLLWVSGLSAYAPALPWGHWEGTITAQFGTIIVELDLSATADGEPSATFSVPERKLNGLPMVALTIDGNTIAFEPAAIGARFKGDLSADGDELSGQFEATAGSVPLTLTRKGEAHIAQAPQNAAVAQEFEGTWSGTLHAAGSKRLVLTIRNGANAGATATLVSVDENGLALPVGIVQKDKLLTVDVKAVGSAFAGTLSADGQELNGTFTTNDGFDLPLTLRRGPLADGKK